MTKPTRPRLPRLPIARAAAGLRRVLDRGRAAPAGPTVLVLTPVKNARREIDDYVGRLRTLTYPHGRIDLGFLESDSDDTTFAQLRAHLPALRREFRSAALWKHDYGYRIPRWMHRSEESIQPQRRAVLARSRNQLLFRALADQDWVLWLDVDVCDYPPNLIERLLATGREIVQPHCVLEYGGGTFDCNAWRDQGREHMDVLRGEGEFVALDAVGGTVLWVRADLHRDGLIFPPVPYGLANPRVRDGRGEVETEGLGILANDMGHTPWGMPNFEVLHRNR